MSKLSSHHFRLLDYVRRLEGKSNDARGEQVLQVLEEMKLRAHIQRCRWPRIRNIVVDFNPGRQPKITLFTAHYDCVKGSPGANDNASGVAVLLGLCRELQGRCPPARIVFFDREEAWLDTPLFRLGLLGSFYYALRNNLHHVDSVFNIEFCGAGDTLAIWPVKGRDERLPVVRQSLTVAAQSGIPAKLTYAPWPVVTSDHLAFRVCGLANAVTLSLLPGNEILSVKEVLASLRLSALFSGRRPALPAAVTRRHGPGDTSSQMTEASLDMMLTILKGIAAPSIPV